MRRHIPRTASLAVTELIINCLIKLVNIISS